MSTLDQWGVGDDKKPMPRCTWQAIHSKNVRGLHLPLGAIVVNSAKHPKGYNCVNCMSGDDNINCPEYRDAQELTALSVDNKVLVLRYRNTRENSLL